MGRSPMEARPSPIAEAIVGRLLPPSCREVVLGDLHERYVSDRQYALDAIRTIPFVIWGQIRRTLSRWLRDAWRGAAAINAGGDHMHSTPSNAPGPGSRLSRRRWWTIA